MTDDELEQKRQEKEIEELNGGLKSEMQMWELGGIDPGNINVNGYLLDQWTFALRDFLVEKGLINENEFLIYFKTRLLKSLKDLRPICMQAKEEAMKEVVTPDPPKIFGPGGPLN